MKKTWSMMLLLIMLLAAAAAAVGESLFVDNRETD